MNKEKKDRIIYFDMLNILAIISVIALHCNGIVHGTPDSRAWSTSLIVECLCYFAVPLFLMLSGANLMNYRDKYDTKTFFKKRFLKVLIPFLFWSIIMFALRIFVWEELKIEHVGVIEIINAFFSNKQESTYYFVWCILGIYLTMPLLSLLANDKYKKTLWFIVLLFFVFNSFIPNVLGLFNINYNKDFSVMMGGYTIYVILGYLLSTSDIKKKYRIIIYIGAFVGLLYRYFTTFILSKQLSAVVKTTWGYTSWHCILLTAAVFLIFKYISTKKNLNNKPKTINILVTLSSCSYAIFLIHKIIMHYECVVLNINTASWQWRTIGVVTTYALSLIIILLLKKIPVVKKIVQ